MRSDDEKRFDVIYDDTQQGKPVVRCLRDVIEISRDSIFIVFERRLGQQVTLATRVIREIRERDYGVENKRRRNGDVN